MSTDADKSKAPTRGFWNCNVLVNARECPDAFVFQGQPWGFARDAHWGQGFSQVRLAVEKRGAVPADVCGLP